MTAHASRINRTLALSIAAATSLLRAGSASPALAGAPCTPEWSNAGADLVGSFAPMPVVITMTEFDPDGPGPMHRDFLMAGTFGFSESPEVSGVARWDGFAWRSVGIGLGFGIAMTDIVYAMCVGPDIARTDGRRALYMVGTFSSVGGIPAQRIAKWDGENWSAIGNLSGSAAFAVTFHDFDGAGPDPQRLVISGAFSNGNVQFWDGNAWVNAGCPETYAPFSLASADPDGDGPLPPALHAATGNLSGRTWTHNGVAWVHVNGTKGSRVYAIDPDGDGPQPTQAFMACSSMITAPWNYGIRIWDGASWQPYALRDTEVNVLAALDLDGGGVEPTQLFAAGASGLWRIVDGNPELFATVNGAPPVYDMKLFDDDGAGPREPVLFLGGALMDVNGLSVSAIARYGCPFVLPRCYGDADGSGFVDFGDISMVIARWGSHDHTGDVDNDGVVGMNDITAVLATWGDPCFDPPSRPNLSGAEEAWRANGVEDFNGDGRADFDDYTFLIAVGKVEGESPR